MLNRFQKLDSTNILPVYDIEWPLLANQLRRQLMTCIFSSFTGRIAIYSPHRPYESSTCFSPFKVSGELEQLKVPLMRCIFHSALRYAHTQNCFYGPYPFAYIGQPSPRGSNPLLLLSGFLIYVWWLILFCLGIQTTKFNLLALMLSLLALSQSKTFFSSVLTTVSRDEIWSSSICLVCVRLAKYNENHSCRIPLMP